MNKYQSFKTLPIKSKRQIAMVFRAYLLANKISWKQIANRRQVEASEPKFGLPPEAIQEFIKICEKKGIKISKVEATKEAHNLINLYKILI